MRKSVKSRKAKRTIKRNKAQAKPVTKTKVVATSKPVTPTVTRSKKARANITEGTRLYALAGRPTKAPPGTK